MNLTLLGIVNIIFLSPVMTFSVTGFAVPEESSLPLDQTSLERETRPCFRILPYASDCYRTQCVLRVVRKKIGSGVARHLNTTLRTGRDAITWEATPDLSMVGPTPSFHTTGMQTPHAVDG